MHIMTVYEVIHLEVQLKKELYNKQKHILNKIF